MISFVLINLVAKSKGALKNYVILSEWRGMSQKDYIRLQVGSHWITGGGRPIWFNHRIDKVLKETPDI